MNFLGNDTNMAVSVGDGSLRLADPSITMREEFQRPGIILRGTAGNDVLNGSNGGDIFYGSRGNDILSGGLALDQVDYAGFGRAITLQAFGTVIKSGGGVDSLTSIEKIVADPYQNNSINASNATGTAFVNVDLSLSRLIVNITPPVRLEFTVVNFVNVTGTVNNDSIAGDYRNNLLDGGGGIGNDTLNGGAGNDTLNGGYDNDILNGGNNNDILNGGDNNDTLNGGAGQDTLTGGTGTGNDTFVFRFGQSTVAAPDRITDFFVGNNPASGDKIDLLDEGGAAMNPPTQFSRAADNANATNLNNLVGGIPTPTLAGETSATWVVAAHTDIAGTYLVVKSTNQNLVINITGATGQLPNLGTIPVTNYFA